MDWIWISLIVLRINAEQINDALGYLRGESNVIVLFLIL